MLEFAKSGADTAHKRQRRISGEKKWQGQQNAPDKQNVDGKH